MFPTSLVPADAYRHPLLEGPRFYLLTSNRLQSDRQISLFSRMFRRNRLNHARIGEITLRFHHGFGAPSTRTSVVNR